VASNWRLNCYRYGLSGYRRVFPGLGTPYTLVARLNPPIVVAGTPFKLLVKLEQVSVWKAAIAFRDDGLEIGMLNWVSFLNPLNFPYGIPVDPD